MIAIRGTTDLEAWKIDMQKLGTLDIPMLYRKGAAIENSLTNGLESLKQSADCPAYIDRISDQVTEIYALSAQLYLSVVLWGNSSRNPAVRLTVAKCLTAIKALPQHLIVRIAFPFCAAGCMASDEEKVSFRTMLEGAEAAGYPLGMLWNSLDVMEEFWKMQEEKGPETKPIPGISECPWTVAMEQWSGWEQSLFSFRIALQIVRRSKEIDHFKSRQFGAINNHYISMMPTIHRTLVNRDEMPLDSAEPLKS